MNIIVKITYVGMFLLIQSFKGVITFFDGNKSKLNKRCRTIEI